MFLPNRGFTGYIRLDIGARINLCQLNLANNPENPVFPSGAADNDERRETKLGRGGVSFAVPLISVAVGAVSVLRIKQSSGEGKIGKEKLEKEAAEEEEEGKKGKFVVTIDR